MVRFMTSVTMTGDPAVPAPQSRRARTLGGAFAIFASHVSPLMIMAITAGAIIGRIAVGDWRWQQLLIVAAVWAAQPFVEWVTHVRVLHARPRRVFGREIDLYVAKKHRRHHADPRNLEILSMPIPGVITFSLLVAGIAMLTLGNAADRLTLAATAAVATLAYEWIHFLIHTDYKPKSSAYRKLYQHHRLHHFRNENYWFGVARRFGDQVLRTNPSKNDVPLSPTCKTILG